MSDTAIVPLSGKAGAGLAALVDAHDADLVSSLNWGALKVRGSRTVYARTSIAGVTISMHRLIMGARPGDEIDHIDGNGLNNTRANLRFVTHSQNIKAAHQRIQREKSAALFDQYESML